MSGRKFDTGWQLESCFRTRGKFKIYHIIMTVTTTKKGIILHGFWICYNVYQYCRRRNVMLYKFCIYTHPVKFKIYNIWQERSWNFKRRWKSVKWNHCWHHWSVWYWTTFNMQRKHFPSQTIFDWFNLLLLFLSRTFLYI